MQEYPNTSVTGPNTSIDRPEQRPMSTTRTALALLDTHIADGFHATAALMREHHGPEHERHEMWAALADVFDHGAEEIGSRVAKWGPDAIEAMNETGRAMVVVARAYLEAVAP